VSTLIYDGGSQAVARVGDTTGSGWMLFDPAVPTIYLAPDLGGTPGAYVPVLTFAGPPPPGTPGTFLAGVITSGNTKLLA